MFVSMNNQTMQTYCSFSSKKWCYSHLQRTTRLTNAANVDQFIRNNDLEPMIHNIDCQPRKMCETIIEKEFFSISCPSSREIQSKCLISMLNITPFALASTANSRQRWNSNNEIQINVIFRPHRLVIQSPSREIDYHCVFSLHYAICNTNTYNTLQCPWLFLLIIIIMIIILISN